MKHDKIIRIIKQEDNRRIIPCSVPESNLNLLRRRITTKLDYPEDSVFSSSCFGMDPLGYFTGGSVFDQFRTVDTLL